MLFSEFRSESALFSTCFSSFRNFLRIVYISVFRLLRDILKRCKIRACPANKFVFGFFFLVYL